MTDARTTMSTAASDRGTRPAADSPRTGAAAGRIAILLATYNGEKHLDEQIRSLFAQSHDDFVVLARDDGSTDRTPDILARWAAARPDKFRVVSDDRGNLRSSGNFLRLMELCDAPYFAFCDQDDVWLPHKLEVLLAALKQIEAVRSTRTPILVHSDLIVVDEALGVIAPSLFHYWHLNVRRGRRLRELLFNNIVTGCALLGNRALLEAAVPIPEAIQWHDWWVSLIAASCGVVSTVAESTVLYRQHGRNQVGAGQQKGHSSLWDGRHVLQQPRLLNVRMTKAMGIVQAQADVLLRTVGDRMPKRNREFLRVFCLPRLHDELRALPWARRTYLRVRHIIVYARAFPLALRWCY